MNTETCQASGKDSSKFIKLKDFEAKEKLESLEKKESWIKIWVSSKKFLTGKVVSFSEFIEDKILTITVAITEIINPHEYVEGKEVCFYFSEGHLEYFAKSKIHEVYENNEIIFALKSPIFKLDQRKKIRHNVQINQAYVFFFVDQSSTEVNKILLLNRPKDDLLEFFRKFMKKVYRNTIEGKDAAEFDRVNNIIGFRLRDISDTGMSFVVNEIEKSFFNKGIRIYQGILNLNGTLRELQDCMLVHLIPCVDSRAPSVPLFKAGMKFRGIKDLTKILVGEMPEENESIKKFLSFVST